MTLRQRDPVVKDEAHLRKVRQLPCVCCLLTGRVNRPSEAAHVRYASAEHGKRQTGMGEKSSDQWVVPLCGAHHRHSDSAQHSMGERRFWRIWSFDPLALCVDLYTAPSVEVMEITVRTAVAAARSGGTIGAR